MTPDMQMTFNIDIISLPVNVTQELLSETFWLTLVYIKLNLTWARLLLVYFTHHSQSGCGSLSFIWGTLLILPVFSSWMSSFQFQKWHWPFFCWENADRFIYLHAVLIWTRQRISWNISKTCFKLKNVVAIYLANNKPIQLNSPKQKWNT